MNLSDPAFIARLRERVTGGQPASEEYGKFITDPLSIWIENTFGIATEKDTGRLIRSKPRCITGENGAALELSELINVPVDRCRDAIQDGLLAGYRCRHPETKFPAFAFRLHQFISRGGNVYASLDSDKDRYITVYGQQFVPGDRSRVPAVPRFLPGMRPGVLLRPQQYEFRKSETRLCRPVNWRTSITMKKDEAGFLYRSEERPWPDDATELIGRLPIDWLEESSGEPEIKEGPPRRVSPKAGSASDLMGLNPREAVFITTSVHHSDSA